MINRQIGRREDEQGEAQGKSSHPFGSYVLHLPSFATSTNILSTGHSLGACMDIGFFIIARKVQEEYWKTLSNIERDYLFSSNAL